MARIGNQVFGGTFESTNALIMNLSYLAGTLHGDAWCSELTIGLFVADQDFAEAFATALRAVSGRTIAVRRSQGYWMVRTSNKTGCFSHIKGHQPITLEEKAMWLRGLFDSEGNAGCYRVKRYKAAVIRRISMYSTEISTLETAKSILAELCIPASISPMKPTKGHLGTKPVFELRVANSKTNLLNFGQLVGSSIARKREGLALMVSTYTDPVTNAREAQLLGAAAKRRKTDEVTVPNVVAGIRALMNAGVKPTQRNCRQIPGYVSVQRWHPQAELVSRAIAL